MQQENRIWKKNISGNENWNNFCPSYDSHSVFLNMSETSWHLLRRDVFPKFILSNGWFLTDCFVQGSSKNTAAPSAWYPRALFQSAHSCNKFQVNLFLFQCFGPVFLSSSSPKVGICSNRCNLHIFSFLRYVPVLWITDKNCNKIIEPVTNKYVGHTPAIY